jgi:hypothetical protein
VMERDQKVAADHLRFFGVFNSLPSRHVDSVRELASPPWPLPDHVLPHRHHMAGWLSDSMYELV